MLCFGEMGIEDVSKKGLYVGAAIATVPAGVTFLIASSKAILIGLIANAILAVLTAGTMTIRITGLSLIKVPFLWKVSKISFFTGSSIVGVSLVALLAHQIYLRCPSQRQMSRWCKKPVF